MNNSNILLESGTGEVEILHFRVSGEDYAINVVKVKELLEIDNISKIPNSNPSVSGVSLIRGDVISVIDMTHVLENKRCENPSKSMTLVCEFNQLKVGFAVDEVLGINRIKWEDISKPSDVTMDSLVIGNINLRGKIVMLLDFEKIVMDINPATGISEERMIEVDKRDRSSYKVLLADDSPMIRKILTDTLTLSGMKSLKFCNDGKEAWEYLYDLFEKYGEKYKEHVDILITDIEMPVLDGHTLTRRVKEHRILFDLPVVIFSSLITDDLLHKGEKVGADAQMSKPEIEKLIGVIDSFLSK